MMPLPHRVTATRQETHDTWTLELEPDGAATAEWAAGQFAMLYAPGVGEVPISVSRIEPLTHTVRAVGAVTEALCASKPGDAVGVRGPLGNGWPLAGAEGRDVVVACGGIGLAPLRPVIEHVLAHRDRYAGLTLLYGGRAPGELLYVDELAGWRARFDVAVEVTVDAAGPEWRGRVGVVTKLLRWARFDPANAVAMVCGPEIMMRLTVEALADRGVPGDMLWLSLERSMVCGVGHCGHCQLGPVFVCTDGPVVRHDQVAPWMAVREL